MIWLKQNSGSTIWKIIRQIFPLQTMTQTTKTVASHESEYQLIIWKTIFEFNPNDQDYLHIFPSTYMRTSDHFDPSHLSDATTTKNEHVYFYVKCLAIADEPREENHFNKNKKQNNKRTETTLSACTTHKICVQSL